jgi:hypothetical protein
MELHGTVERRGTAQAASRHSAGAAAVREAGWIDMDDTVPGPGSSVRDRQRLLPNDERALAE